MGHRRKSYLWAFFLALLAGSIIGYRLWITGDREATNDLFSTQRTLMGTEWSIQIVLGGNVSRIRAESAVDEAFAELHRVESVMSEWLPESPLSQINASAGIGPVEVPVELREIIRRGIEWGRLSNGAFDITWLGLGSLWHFDESFVPPEPSAISRALANVDYRKVRIQNGSVFLEKAGMAIGLGGIAKGYGIDRAGTVLGEAGIGSFLINGGGDILTSGNRGGRPWRIGIRDPRGGPTDLVARLNVGGRAVVTSGDYERFKIVDGIRYHHIIDPRTGAPARKCRSVTVVAPRAETADVLATAVFVLGPAEGLRLAASQPETETFVIDSEGKFWMTSRFKDLAEFF